MSTVDIILETATRSAQAHGYGGLNLRRIAAEVGIKAASIYHHFPSKADLGAAVAKRYWQETSDALASIATEEKDPRDALRRYPEIFRRSLEKGNRLCLGSFMAAEHDDLPPIVEAEIRNFADVNVAWLKARLKEAGLIHDSEAEARGRAIFAAIAGAQLQARSRSDIQLFDTLVATYEEIGVLSVAM